MFSKKTDGATSSFEKKADNRPNKTRQRRSGFCPKRFKPIPQICREFFQSVGNCANNRPDCDARSQKYGCHRNAIFFENFFYFSSKSHGFFSFLNLSLQISKLFVSLCNSFFGGFFVLGENIFII